MTIVHANIIAASASKNHLCKIALLQNMDTIPRSTRSGTWQNGIETFIWDRRGGWVVESTALEMRHTRKGIVGSNPTLSASTYWFYSLFFINFSVYHTLAHTFGPDWYTLTRTIADDLPFRSCANHLIFSGMDTHTSPDYSRLAPADPGIVANIPLEQV